MIFGMTELLNKISVKFHIFSVLRNEEPKSINRVESVCAVNTLLLKKVKTIHAACYGNRTSQFEKVFIF